jgi:hypothetical protein
VGLVSTLARSPAEGERRLSGGEAGLRRPAVQTIRVHAHTGRRDAPARAEAREVGAKDEARARGRAGHERQCERKVRVSPAADEHQTHRVRRRW